MILDHFVIIGRDNCPWCEKAIDLIEDRGLSYHYFDVRKNEGIRAFLVQNGLNTVPQIYNDGELVGGYDDLVHYMEDY